MRKVILKKLFGIMLCVGTVASLASCGKEGGNNKKNKDYSHTIIYYHTQGDNLQAVTNEAIAEFEANNPGWKVESTQAGGWSDIPGKIIGDFQAKSQPDVAYCYPDHVASYLKTGKVIDISQFLDEENPNILKHTNAQGQEIVSTIYENYFEEGRATNFGNYAQYGYTEDSILTLPYVRSTEAMYYNKTVLDALDLDPATTWEEIWEQAEIIKEEYPNMVTLAYDSEANWFITMCEQNGWNYTSAAAPHYTFENNASEIGEWLEDLHDYYEKGYLTTQEVYGNYTSGLFTKTDGTGCVYCIGSTGGASYQFSTKFDCCASAIPGMDTGEHKNACISQGPSFVFLETELSENKDEKAQMAYKFVSEYLMDPYYQARFSNVSGYTPCVQEAFDTEIQIDGANVKYGDYVETVSASLNGVKVESKNEMIALAVLIGRETIENQFVSPAFTGSSTAREQVGNAVVSALQSSDSGASIVYTAVANCGGND